MNTRDLHKEYLRLLIHNERVSFLRSFTDGFIEGYWETLRNKKSTKEEKMKKTTIQFMMEKESEIIEMFTTKNPRKSSETDEDYFLRFARHYGNWVQFMLITEKEIIKEEPK